MLLLLLLLSNPAFATVATVDSAKEFVGAFLDNNVSTITLVPPPGAEYGDIDLAYATLPYTLGNPCRISRNVTIRSEPALALLDFHFTQGKCILDPNVTVEFDGVVLYNLKYGTGVNIDMFLHSPGARVVIHNAVRRRAACLPSKQDPLTIASLPRAPGFPGAQQAGSVPLLCVRGRCYEQALHYHDVALESSVSPDQTEYAGGYVVWLVNTTAACDTFVDQACIEAVGGDTCVLRAIDKMLTNATEANGDGVSDGDGGSVNAAAIVVPVVAGISLFALGSVLALRRHRRRARAPPGDAATGGKLGSGGSSTARGGGGGGGGGGGAAAMPAPAGWRVIAHRSLPGTLPSAPGSSVSLGVLLGTGSYGRVYRGRWLGRDVAVKVLQHNSAHSARVAQECDLIMGSGHPNLVCAYHYTTWQRPPGPSSALNGDCGDGAGSGGSGSVASGGGGMGDGSDAGVVAVGGACVRSGAGSADAGGGEAWAGQGGAAVEGLGVASLSEDGTTTTPAVRAAAAAAAAAPAPAPAPAPPLGSAASSSQPISGATLSTSQRHVLIDMAGCDTCASDGGGTELDAQTCIVTEYCNGGSLEAAARQGKLTKWNGTPTILPLLNRLVEVAEGMRHLHARGVMHGDLKASNIMLASAPGAPFGAVAKVSDFGLARVLAEGQTHRSTRTLGTVTHMAPTLLRSGKMAPESDVYSFGIMMWELLLGKTAFGGMHYGEVVERVVLRDERPPLPDGVPEDYVLLMTACWAAADSSRPSFEAIQRCLLIMVEHRLRATAEAEGEAALLAAAGGPVAGGGSEGGGGAAGDARAAALAALRPSGGGEGGDGGGEGGGEGAPRTLARAPSPGRLTD